MIDSLEIDRDAYEVLGRNISDNSLEGRVSSYPGDVRELPDEIRQKQYDIVFMNPPFFHALRKVSCTISCAMAVSPRVSRHNPSRTPE